MVWDGLATIFGAQAPCGDSGKGFLGIHSMTLAPHALAGAIIQKAGSRAWYAWGPLAIISHYFLDYMNTQIYHGPLVKAGEKT